MNPETDYDRYEEQSRNLDGIALDFDMYKCSKCFEIVLSYELDEDTVCKYCNDENRNYKADLFTK